MTLKSVIDIDVNDSSFTRFSALFNKYNEQLAKTPNAWKAVGTEQAAMATQFERMTAAMMAQAHQARETSEDDKKRLNNLTLSERLWTSMAKSTGSFAKNILHAGESLVRWTGLLGAVSGLLGAGGLFGIDRMAARASGERRSATGKGMSIGQEKAFDVNFSRFANPNAFLSGVNAAVTDISKQGPLWALGVNPNQSTAQVAIATLKALRAKALATDYRLLGTTIDQFHLGDIGVGEEDLRRLKEATPDEFNKQLAGYGKDVGALGINDKTAQAWQDFTTQMQRAGETIFKTFVVGLSPLAPALEHLSSAFIKFLDVLMKSPQIDRAITGLADWLNDFSGEISTPAFLDNVKGFVANIGEIAEALASALKYLKIPLGPVADIGGGVMSHLWGKNFKANPTTDQYRQLLAQQDKAFGFPAGTLERQWRAESGGSLSPKDSPKGAVGPFQFMPATARELGFDPRDPLQSVYGAAAYDEQLRAKYGGDMMKALAAYNMGPAALDRVLSKHGGADWLNYAPKETRDYVSKQSGIKVVVNNNTGGSAVVAVSALAPPPGIALP